ncbi:phage tail protein [Streptomyces luteireticuli]|uniref:phage tail protein n=1 Tax=Streptomyces luteireticuli TaxID=173858 RepID=UPI003556DB2B
MLPNSIPTVTVTARYLTPDGLPLSGNVTFRAPTLLTHTGSDTILGGPIIVPLDGDGRIKAVLPATDTPGMNPAGWTYTVVEQLAGLPANRTYDIVLPAAQKTVDLADLAPVDPEAPHYVAVPGPPGPAGAPGAAGPAGAPGLVQSVNGKSAAAVELTAADVKAVPAASVGQAGGVAALDASGKVPSAQLPPGAVAPVSSVNDKKGEVKLVASDVGALDQAAADLRYVQQSAAVLSVNGRTGQIALDAAALGAAASGSVVSLTGDQTVSGTKTFANVPMAKADPTTGDHLVRKSYIDSLGAPGVWGPVDLGFKAWTFDPASASMSMAVPGEKNPMQPQYCYSGQVYLMGVVLHAPTEINKLAFYVHTYKTDTLSAASYAGLYDANGKRVAATSSLKDIFPRVLEGNTVAFPLSATYTAQPGFYWVAFVLNGPADKQDGPGFAVGANYGLRPSGGARMPGAFVRHGRLPATGQTSLPASFNPSTVIDDTNAIWAAVA